MPNMVRVPRAGTLLITLPSDSTSRWTPLRSANGWQLPAPVADFHRQVTHHAWRTRKNRQPNAAGFLISLYTYASFCQRRTGCLAALDSSSLVTVVFEGAIKT